MSNNPRWNNRPKDSNWGDYGQNDQLGRLNNISPEVRLRAFNEVKTGRVFCLSLPLDRPGGTFLNPNRRPPERVCDDREPGWPSVNYPWSRKFSGYTDCICDDAIKLYTQYSTHWDSLAHVGHVFDAAGQGESEIVYYNGFKARQHILEPDQPGGPGAQALGIERMAETCVQGRGVMIDLLHHLGTEPIDVGFSHIERILQEDRIIIEPGDIVCFHTGFAQELVNPSEVLENRIDSKFCAIDGQDEKTQKWIIESGISAIVSDNIAIERINVDPKKSGEHRVAMPLHELCLFKLGVHLGELWYLTELSNWLNEARRSYFLLTAPPLRMPGSFGSPVTPVATV